MEHNGVKNIVFRMGLFGMNNRAFRFMRRQQLESAFAKF